MTPDSPFDRAAAILEEVAELPPAERTQTAFRLAEENPEVLALLKPMLRGLEDDGSALERPAVELPPGLEEIEIPEQIAGYRIVRPLGEGGMGVVYEAQQSSPNRRVALKLLRGGAFDPLILKRFEQETAVLGYLNHPGIAQVFEGGTAQIGATAQPFIAMEMVQGMPIDQYVAKHRLSIRARVELLGELCDAVQHAHQKGVVHRDLKPVNVLVTDKGRVKVLDFGIARITASDFQATQGPTSTGQIVGTLPYMSPEQVAGDPAMVDTRCDVYSLGVIAYEMFSGQRPLDVTGKSLPEAARIITEQEPKALGTLHRDCRGDLEVIVGKALSKDREQRYGSAGTMADDLRRYLSLQPIVAQAPSRAYILRKFVRRNPGLVLGISTLVLLSVGFAVVTGIQNQRISVQRDLAERKNKLSWEVADFLVELFETANPTEERSKQLTARGLLDIGAKRIQHDVTADPELRSELLLVMARTYNALGVPSQARPLLEEAIALRESLDLEPQGLVSARFEQAVLFSLEGRFSDAVQSLDRILETLPSEAPEPGNLLRRVQISKVNTYLALGKRNAALELAQAAYEQEVARSGPNSFLSIRCLAIRGTALEEMARYDEALEDLLAAEKAMKAIKGEDSPEYITILRMLGDLYLHMERPAQSFAIMEKAIELDRAVFGDDHPNVDEDLYSLASAVWRLGEVDRALGLFHEVYERDQRILGPEHPYVGVDCTEIANIYSQKGEAQKAEEWFERGWEIQEKTYPENHPELATTLSNWAGHHNRNGRTEEALKLHQRALAIRELTMPPDHPTVLTSRNSIAVMLGDLGRTEESEAILREVLALREATLGHHSMVANSLFNLAHCLADQERYEESLEYLDRAEEIFVDFRAQDHLDLARLWSFRGRLLNALKRPNEAWPHLQEALRVRSAKLTPGNRQIAVVKLNLSDSWFQLGDAHKGHAEFCEALQMLVDSRRPGDTFPDRVWADYLERCRKDGMQPNCSLEEMRAALGE